MNFAQGTSLNAIQPKQALSMHSVLPDVLMASGGFLIFLVYHLVFLLIAYKHPLRTTIGQNNRARTAWCKGLCGKLPYSIVAVQTLRNGMLASQLLATTSFTITSALAVIIVSTNWQEKAFGTPITGISFLANATVIPPIKMFLLIFFFITAFFCYLQSIRAYYHSSFLITIPEIEAGYVDYKYIARILRRGSTFHMVGTRLFYAAFLALLWLFGPIPVVVGAVVLTVILYKLDYLEEPGDGRKVTSLGSSQETNVSSIGTTCERSVPSTDRGGMASIMGARQS